MITTWLGSLSLLQGIFPTQGSNPGLPHYRQILYQLSHKGSPRILEWVAYPFSSWSSWPRKLTWASCIADKFFTNFSGGWDSKAPACNAGDPDSIPGLGRCPGIGNGDPLQYSCLENPTDRGAWWDTVCGITQNQAWLSTQNHSRACWNTDSGVSPTESLMQWVLCRAWEFVFLTSSPVMLELMFENHC